MQLLEDTKRPIQFVFAGKAHPADHEGKELIKAIVNFARDPAVRRRMVFLENYDINVARYLVQGVDVWLNTPRRPYEASGTSGMKAAANGVPNCSILDGWWVEGYAPMSAGPSAAARTTPTPTTRTRSRARPSTTCSRSRSSRCSTPAAWTTSRASGSPA